MTGRICHHGLIALASSLGGLYTVLTAVFYFIPIWFSLFGKLFISIAMVLMAYVPESIWEFMRKSACFYVSTFVLAGAAYALEWKSLWIIPGVLVGALLILVVMRVIRAGKTEEHLVKLELFPFDHESMVVTALADTGCSLKDPISGNVAIILGKSIPSMERQQMRLIPYSTATDSGVLTGVRFQMAKAFLSTGVKELPFPVICPVNRPLGNGMYQAIISADALK